MSRLMSVAKPTWREALLGPVLQLLSIKPVATGKALKYYHVGRVPFQWLATSLSNAISHKTFLSYGKYEQREAFDNKRPSG